MLLDLGCGDGTAVIDAARADATLLAVGLDSAPDAVGPRSRRAARARAKGGLPNALFLVGDARHVPAPFHGRVDELRIVLPWGSLLETVLAGELSFASEIASALQPGGIVRTVVSITDRDRSAGSPPRQTDHLEPLGTRLRACGLDISSVTAAEPRDLEWMRSSWAKRLGVPSRRPTSLLTGRRRRDGR